MQSESTGFNFILWGNMVRSELPDEMRAFVDAADPAAWYPTEKLLQLIDHIRTTQGAARVEACGRAIYYTLKEDLEKMGILTPEQAILSIVDAYKANNRGPDSGEWRLLERGENRILLEDRTCFARSLVNPGVAAGAAKAFGGHDVAVKTRSFEEGAQVVHAIEVSWR